MKSNIGHLETINVGVTISDEAKNFEELCREVARCHHCFKAGSNLKRAKIDIAQPRRIGPNYWRASCRILILMLNPGSGEGRPNSAHQEPRKLIEAFRNGNGSLQEIFEYQRKDMPEWGRGRFLPFYKDLLDLPSVDRLLNEVAFANVAWCGTKGDQYPGRMLDECYSRHTEKLLSILKSHAVLLSGTGVHKFFPEIQALLPTAQIYPILHYAHRKGRDCETQEKMRLKSRLGAMQS